MNRALRAVIADDEPLARARLLRMLGELGSVEVVAQCTSARETLDALRRYAWPGNIRELANLIERAMILSQGRTLEVPLAELQRAPRRGVKDDGTPTLEGIERAHILRILDETNWMLSGPRGAAVKLGMKRTTLQSLMKRLGIAKPA